MKLLLLVFLGILALNVLVIVAVMGILIIDHFRTRRRAAGARAADEDAHANAS